MSAFDSVRFNSGRPLLNEITADKLNAILREIRKNRPRGERGITVRESGDATYIGLAKGISSAAAAEGTHPFKILTRTQDEQTFIGVEPESYVFTDFTDSAAPSGLLTDANDPDDENWQEASGLQYVWLEYDETTNAFSVEFGTEGDFDPTLAAWTAKSILENDDDENFPVFTKARRLIAEIVNGEEGISVVQTMKQHQNFLDVVVNGIPAGYFFATDGGLPPSNE